MATRPFGRGNSSDTRKAAAKEIMETLERGFSTDSFVVFDGFTKEQAEKVKAAYRLWSSSWIIPKLERLLRKDLKGE